MIPFRLLSVATLLLSFGTSTRALEVDFAITKTCNVTEAAPGATVVYTIEVWNDSIVDDPMGQAVVRVQDLLPPSLENVIWTETGSGNDFRS